MFGLRVQAASNRTWVQGVSSTPTAFPGAKVVSGGAAVTSFVASTPFSIGCAQEVASFQGSGFSRVLAPRHGRWASAARRPPSPAPRWSAAARPPPASSAARPSRSGAHRKGQVAKDQGFPGF